MPVQIGHHMKISTERKNKTPGIKMKSFIMKNRAPFKLGDQDFPLVVA
jgi:hypothetical protein